MTRPISRNAWINLAGAVAIAALMTLVSAAEAGQAERYKGGGNSAAKGHRTEPQNSVVGAGQISAITGGAVAGFAVAADQTACSNGTATACRTLEAGLATGGAWAFVDGGISAMDDWESPNVRRSSPAPRIALTHRALAACDAGDVSACRAFAASVRPATATERTERRTYTGGW
ncbi:MAG: hypothetical protein V4701_12395 [Pseudomonadota bacterium]